MIFKTAVRLSAFSACLALLACTLNNNTSLPPAPSNPPPVLSSFTVPAADANDFLAPTHTPAGGGPAYSWDISSMESQRIGPPGTTYTELVVSTTFEHPDGTPDNLAFAALPAPGTGGVAGINLNALIAINIGATTTSTGQCGTDTFPNISFIVNLGGGLGPRLADGNAAILDATLTQVGEAQISGGASVVTVTIPISAVGGSSSGPFNIEGFWGTGTFQNDCAPNGGYLSDSSARLPLSAGAAVPLGIPLGLGIYMR